MSSSIFNTNAVDFTQEKMFFGKEPNMQRFDVFKYPIFEKLNSTMLGFFWLPEEVSLQKDRSDYQKLTDTQKHIFTSNLKYQILLDSVQARGPALAFMPHVSIPELEACTLTWDFFEMIHARSYTHIIKNLYPNPTEIFDTIMGDEKIMTRAKSVTKYYDGFMDYWLELHRAGHDSPDTLPAKEAKELRRRLYLAMVAVNILEGIRFYVSFACNFAFAENKLMEGSAKILGLIARDENIHLTIAQHIISIWRTTDEDPIMKDIIKEEKETVLKMYHDAVQEEKDWATYLFKDGSMIGLNATLLHQYIEYLANRRLRAIGIEKMFPDVSLTQNPLPWMSNWLNSKDVQVAPQETESSSYVVGGVDNEVKEEAFNDFKL